MTPGIQTKPNFLEYKLCFDSRVRDFDNEDKNPEDLGLVIVWTMGNDRWKERFQAISYLLPDYRDRRQYHGITHEMYETASNRKLFDCIVLEELILYLNDPPKYYAEYAKQYSED